MTDKFTAIYNMLWNTSFDAVSRGEIEIDRFISNPKVDRRRGLTLIFRPADEMKSNILSFLEETRQLEPGQYCYPEASLHFTVLTLFTATVDHQQEYDHMDGYQAAVEDALQGVSSFSFHLKGLTVSKSALILCGFPQPDNLNVIRQKLRGNLGRSGLTRGLDRRYTLTAAHTTILRFSNPLRSPARFSEFLLENKLRDFGTLTVKNLQLMKNDWYMSPENSTLIKQFAINDRPNN